MRLHRLSCAYLCLAFLLVCSAQQKSGPKDLTAEDLAVLQDIFDIPSSASPPETASPKLQDIVVQPTTAPTSITDSAGRRCICVPYYLCDPNTNETLTTGEFDGYGQLDIRFKEDSCQESVEVCCYEPIEPGKESTPAPPALPRGCGRRNTKGVDFQISNEVNGENLAQFGEFPWTAALLNRANESCMCAGSLIHPQVIMTGAHCVFNHLVNAIKIRVGEWDTQTTKERLPYQERTLSDMVIHPEFHPKTLANDMALLRLSSPVELDQHINVVCLPDQDERFDEAKDCVANGWGKDVFGKAGRYSVIMKKVFLDVVPYGRCQALLQRTRLSPRFRLHHSFLCAGGEEGKDTCQGDGGAPLSCPIGDRYRQAGIVAWGIGCGGRDVPAVYTKVANFRTWVDSIVRGWGFDTSVYTQK